ncbi:citrate/2-methylcitrate synthase [Piscinibacter terrae]|uniref:citrate synthase (unknown stereospecificity) n=1 Tax=Piscinibacter terrae TaxID=2496871 RepID=A0A3N7J1K1_9BURK|nr:citrate/2-methylcitrate synthase [Albitalea terrae]RQP24822.1 citryl-CoA lyase [Albitalea terrae]
MKGPALLQAAADKLSTRMGQCFVGSRTVFRGRDLHADLRDMDWVELYIFAITGREFSRNQLQLLHAMWVYTSYPDARLWNNRVAALAGSTRSTPALGMSAALGMSEAVVYGGHPCVRAIDFLLSAQGAVAAGATVDDVVREELKHRRIFGYGRPINSVDERLPWLIALARDLGLDQGPHLALALEVERVLVGIDARLKMNYAALTAALAADLGLSVREFHHFQVPMLLAGMTPCFIEASERPAGTVFPLSSDHIAYEGPARRRWPQRS